MGEEERKCEKTFTYLQPSWIKHRDSLVLFAAFTVDKQYI
jgi:hypothetical protein